MEIYYIGFVIFIFLLINAVLIACELSLVRLRYQLLSRKEKKDVFASDEIASIIDRSDHVARSVRLGYTVCMIGIGLLLYPFLLCFSEAQEVNVWLLSFSYVAIVLIHYIFSGLIPRAYALAMPERVLLNTSWFVSGFSTLLTPVLWIMARIDKKVFKFFKLDISDDLNDLSVEVQISALNNQNQELSTMTRNILHNALQMSELEVSDVLLPRNQIQFFDLNDDIQENLDIARKTGHTRFPLCEGDLDHCIGIVHIKDVFRLKKNESMIKLSKIKRPVIRIKHDALLDDVLQSMLLRKMHMALVADEFGGVIGVITLESLLEELVGDIQDEFDFEEALIKPLDNGFFRVSGLIPIHDLEEELGVTIDHGEVSTFGGLITSTLGRLPNRGEVFSLKGLEVRTEEVDARRVILLSVKIVDVEYL